MGQKNSELKEIIVETDAPVIVKGGFTTDLQRIWIEFDKNVDGETLCSALFTKETYQVLGSDPSCSYVGNTLWVMLGKNSIIQSTDEIKIMPDKIRSSHGDNKYAPAFKGTFPLKINKNKFKAQKPMYRLIGANFICPGEKLDPHKFQSSNYNISSDAKRNLSSEVIIRSLDSAYIKYNASLLFQVDNDYMEPNERQRNNLLTWFSVRQLQKSILIQDIMDRIVINNSLLIQHVNYTLSVVGQNRFGDAGDEINMSFYQLKEMNNTNKPLQLLLSGPYQVNPYTEILIETKIIPSCTENHELPYNTKYKWKLESSTSTIDLSSYSGSKLHLPGGTLQPNLKCTIYCHLINKDTNEALLSESFELETLTSPLEVRIGVTNLEIGTGQSLELWVSTNLISTADDKVQFNWICEYNSEKCLAPGPNSTELSEVYKKEFQQKVLKLKPGSLAVGRYTFKVKAVMKDNKSFAVTEPTYITVIPGEHPQIQILKYSIKPLNPNEGLFIPAKIFNLKPGCVMNWEVERENSFDYINLKSLRNIQSNLILSSDSNTKSKEFPLQIPGKDDNNGSLTLKEGASYKISHSVYCGGNRHSSASIVIYTDVLPKPEKLKVQPSEGIALITRFYFSTKRAYAPLQDHPLIYSFGYKLPNESPQFIYTSADWLHTEILMPSGSFKGSEVVTLLKVCNVRQVCIVEIGPTIYTKPPETLSSSALRLLGLEYIRLLSGQEYNEALSTALSSLKTLQTLTDKIAYNNISKQVESAIISEMDAISQDLERKKQMLIKPAVALLDTATTTLQYIPKSDTALSQIVAFKNKILSSLNNEGISDLKMRNSLAGNTDSFSSNLNSSLLKIRIKRRDETFKENAMSYNMIKTLMKASEVAILNLNDSKAVVAETKELLHNMEKYITSLCSQVSEEHEYYIGTKIAIVSVKMITIITTYSEDILIPNCPTNCDMKKAAYFNARTETQQLGQLPCFRVVPSRPFSACGADYGGPIMICHGGQRSKSLTKAYIALFICLATMAFKLLLN
ncbi:uncharacterized protein LOC142326875 [Lycorma delicatula]|uniref:uncharacterized protein LOC142326875 n=1 Tax=Lycorma delicatula TaxID=130591 RepID=UPI003F512087